MNYFIFLFIFLHQPIFFIFQSEIKARKKALRDEKAKAKAAPKANPQPTKPANKLSKQPKQAKPKMPKGQIKK